MALTSVLTLIFEEECEPHLRYYSYEGYHRGDVVFIIRCYPEDRFS